MKKIKIISSLVLLSILFLFPKSGFSQNGNSLNQHDKNKNSVGSNNKLSNPKKSKSKISNSKNGNLDKQISDDDKLPVDSLEVVPTNIMNNKKDK